METKDVSTELFIKICQPVIIDRADFLCLLTTAYVVEQNLVVKAFLEHTVNGSIVHMAVCALAFVILCHQDFKTEC